MTWWKEAVVYQIYPRSFKDSNGDGIGDLQGIISRLDYVSSLGVDVIWLNPIFKSPNDDNGYDISDYKSIMTEFGSMKDFDLLLSEMHKRGLKLVLDLVVNHSSDEHEWFKTRPDFYHWWKLEQGLTPARYSYLAEKNHAWTYVPEKKASYLHYFSKKQPDLNWENPELREEIYAMMKFWLDKGIDGFRMDVIPLISKDPKFPPMPSGSVRQISEFYASGPRLHEYLTEMNERVLSKYDCMSVAEGLGVTKETALSYAKNLNMLYHFEGMDIETDWDKTGRKFDLEKFKCVYSEWDDVFKTKGWGTVYLGNHDQPRMVSRWGDDREEFREASAKLLMTFILTMRGTAYFYQGDELGMKNATWNSVEECDDVELKNMLKSDVPKDVILRRANTRGRDNARVPFAWDATAHGGFTGGKPWIKTSDDFKTVNAELQERDPESCLHFFRKLIKLRKSEASLTQGDYTLIPSPDLYVFERSLENKRFKIALNFSDKILPFSSEGRVILNNLEKHDVESLFPWQALIFAL